MFDELQLLAGPPPRRITLQAANGDNIGNEVAVEPAPKHVANYERHRRAHARWLHRRDACGRYNCHGHVFANRRTAVYEDAEVEKLLRGDGLRRIEWQAAIVGDIVLYRASHGFVHAGAVVSVNNQGGLPEIWVLSKWNDYMGEDLHLVNDVLSQFDRWEVWTERPA